MEIGIYLIVKITFMKTGETSKGVENQRGEMIIHLGLCLLAMEFVCSIGKKQAFH